MPKWAEQAMVVCFVLAMNFCNLFRNEASAVLCECYIVAGAIFSVFTNSEAIRAAMRESFAQAPEPHSPADVSMRLWVDFAEQRMAPSPRPYFRGLSHFVFAGFDSKSALLVDLRRRHIIGRLSPAMAADRIYLKTVVLPALFGVVSQVIGVAALHCACVAQNGNGLLLAGDSGSGKSMLSLALAQSGLAFLSDDWTYVSRRDGRVLAWGLNTPLKLLPDAVEHFPELAETVPTISLNGEMAYEVDPDREFGIERCASVAPRWLMFLERQDTPGISLMKMSGADAAARLEQDLEELPAAISRARGFLVKTIRILAQLPCWRLRYGGTPHAIARVVCRFLDGGAADLPCREN